MVQVSNDTESVIDTDTAGRGIAGIDYRVLGIAHHYIMPPLFFYNLYDQTIIPNAQYVLFPTINNCKL